MLDDIDYQIKLNELAKEILFHRQYGGVNLLDTPNDNRNQAKEKGESDKDEQREQKELFD